MKIEAKDTSKLSLKDIIPGTAFWHANSLYMRILDTYGCNVVALSSGKPFKWYLENVSVAKVKIVPC